jgi:hypothetical protein
MFPILNKRHLTGQENTKPISTMSLAGLELEERWNIDQSKLRWSLANLIIKFEICFQTQ